ncbi:MAG: phosphoenolpyruvate--protein phosphotransferase [Spirochaetaceae bacterium]|jgi:phosphocarrier protein FPr|nr:phosphoenolpyruvate--protein phosphotransferase [Spirochaetaceae bacterium]
MNDENRGPELIMKLGMAFSTKSEVIHEVCSLLFSAGCVEKGYEQSMLKREKAANTWLGAGLAIPHGVLEDKGMVKRDGLVVLQSPAGVDWGNGNTATLIVAIAAAGDSHISILRQMTGLLQDENKMNRLSKTRDESELKAAFLNRTEGEDEALPDFALSREWVLDYPAGLHARPGLVWSETAKESTAVLRVRHDKKSADPRKLVALLHLGLKSGDRLTISADGPGAEEALERFIKVICSLSAQEKEQAAKAQMIQKSMTKNSATPSWAENITVDCITGIGASPGFCSGKIFSIDSHDIEVPDIPMSLDQGAALLEEAAAKAKQQLKAVMDDTERRLGAADAEIFKAHSAFLEDRDLIAACAAQIVNGHGPAWSWKNAVEELAKSFEMMDNPVLEARAADIRDAGRRVLGFLLPEDAAVKKIHNLPDEKVVILAKDLSPADMAEIDPDKTAGIITIFGSPTSHMAILARTMGIPTVVACDTGILAIAEGETVIVDGSGGFVYYHPSPEALEAAGKEQAKREQHRKEQIKTRSLPAKTIDGHTIAVFANINNPEQAPLALDMGAEGVGLMRTEFLFLERGTSPSEDDQMEVYTAMAKAMDNRVLIIRALDIGGDKQIVHLNLEKEDNPFLGVRGARLLLRRQDILLPQLKAIYRSAKENKNIKLMFPMITSLEELRRLRDVCEQIRKDLSAPKIPLGIMIEVPAAAILAGVFAREADFFSIGTNDLTQYTLAMDRQNPVLAQETDGLHPAVLTLIKTTVEGAKKYNRPVGVCGGIAGDKTGALVLAGLGIDELSMTPRDIPEIKEIIRAYQYGKLTELAKCALSSESPSKVHSLLESL